MNKTMWAASFKYGGAHLAKVIVTKETDRSYSVSESKDILGWSWFSKARTLKENYEWFESPELAIKWLSRCYDENIMRMESDIERLRKEQKTLTETLTALEAVADIAPAARPARTAKAKEQR